MQFPGPGYNISMEKGYLNERDTLKHLRDIDPFENAVSTMVTVGYALTFFREIFLPIKMELLAQLQARNNKQNLN